jgi:hypothetical protein
MRRPCLVHISTLNVSHQDVTPRPHRSSSFPFPPNQLALKQRTYGRHTLLLPSQTVELSTQSSEHSNALIPHPVVATLTGVGEAAPMSDAMQMAPVSGRENLDVTSQGDANSSDIEYHGTTTFAISFLSGDVTWVI